MRKIPKQRLIDEARGFLGISSHLAAGALHAADDELTVEEAKAQVNAVVGG